MYHAAIRIWQCWQVPIGPERVVFMPEDPTADRSARYTTETLMPQVYEALKRLATHRLKQHGPGQSVSGTALVHEAYIRLSKESDGPRWVNRSQFFSAAAEAMRRILIDRIRAKGRIKRGGEYRRVTIDEIEDIGLVEDERLMEINEALDELAKVHPDRADLVKMRFFVGLTLEEVAEALGVSLSTVTRQWAYVRAWLTDYLSDDH